MVIKRPITHPSPVVSVVIPTIPQNDFELPVTLKEQTEERYEVVIVSDETIDRCMARNEGMKKASADIIAQTDDDCIPPRDWVEQRNEQFRSNPELLLVGGPLDKHDSGPHRYLGANLAYRKEEALSIGGFDKELAGWRADTDFGWRMEIEYGLERCEFDPNLVIDHNGPLRTDVNRDLEQKFRGRYPERYFTRLYPPKAPFGRRMGAVLGRIYRLSPRLAELMIRSYRYGRNHIN